MNMTNMTNHMNMTNMTNHSHCTCTTNMTNMTDDMHGDHMMDMDEHNHFGHSFHTHVVPFLVTQIDGEAVETPFWRDTMPVFMSIKIHICFPRHDGHMVVHCHMPSHQDVGMAATYNVVSANETRKVMEVEALFDQHHLRR